MPASLSRSAATRDSNPEKPWLDRVHGAANHFSGFFDTKFRRKGSAITFWASPLITHRAILVFSKICQASRLAKRVQADPDNIASWAHGDKPDKARSRPALGVRDGGFAHQPASIGSRRDSVTRAPRFRFQGRHPDRAARLCAGGGMICVRTEFPLFRVPMSFLKGPTAAVLLRFSDQQRNFDLFAVKLE